jgi:hypothetical protein
MPPLVGTEPHFHQRNEGRRVISRLLFVVCFCVCSVAIVQAQADFTEAIETSDPTGGCNKSSNTKKSISCSHSGSDSNASYYEEGIAKNSFGIMRGYTYSEVTCVVNLCSASDGSLMSEIIEDELSILGLKNEPTAFLKLDFVCLECWKIANLAYAWYAVSAKTKGYSFGTCFIPNSENSPHCRARAPLVYNVNTGQPYPVYIERQLEIDATTRVVKGPAGATVKTAVAVGYYGLPGATVTASVVDAKGNLIKGVTVVGSSGHIYN